MPVVAIIYDGSEIVSSRPATLTNGTVMAPLDPYLSRLAGSIEVDPRGRTITLHRADASVTVTLGDRTATVGPRVVRLPIAPYLRDGGPIIPLAAVARGLGLTVSFDPRSRVASVGSADAGPVATMTPFAPVPGASTYASPRVDDTPTPRPTVTGIPRPRRTPIELRAEP